MIRSRFCKCSTLGALLVLAVSQLWADDDQRTRDLKMQVSGLGVQIANIDMLLADAEMVSTMFKNVRSAIDYQVVMLMMTTTQTADCKKFFEGRSKAEKAGESPLFIALEYPPDGCKVKSLDLDGLASFRDQNGVFSYSPQAVWLINSQIEAKIKSLTENRRYLSYLKETLSGLLNDSK